MIPFGIIQSKLVAIFLTVSTYVKVSICETNIDFYFITKLEFNFLLYLHSFKTGLNFDATFKAKLEFI
jgi:hypothetical protein